MNLNVKYLRVVKGIPSKINYKTINLEGEKKIYIHIINAHRYNLTKMICKCGSNMVLRLAQKGQFKGSFFWDCTAYPLCSNIQNYVVPENRFDFANNDFMPIIRSLNSQGDNEKQEIIAEIKVQMIEILKHFIECTWGAHYNTMFDMLIKPFLTDPKILDLVLRSEIINESKGNVIYGITGAKIYPELNDYLSKVNSSEIKQYLFVEFPTTKNNI